MGKVGIFGGTFNPIHWGHLLAAETALTQVSLDRIVWVPTSHTPYKPTDQVVSFRDRHRMVRLAIDPHPQFVLTVSEASRYAVDTLKTLQHRHGSCEWYWILGLDAFRSLPRWVGRRELIPQCTWLVVPRWTIRPVQQSDDEQFPDRYRCTCDEFAAATLDGLEACCQNVAAQLLSEAIEVKWQLLQMPMVQVSSSLVRTYCQQGRSIRYLVPDAVRDYIAAHQLYGVCGALKN